jgi:hypothetical protein
MNSYGLLLSLLTVITSSSQDGLVSAQSSLFNERDSAKITYISNYIDPSQALFNKDGRSYNDIVRPNDVVPVKKQDTATYVAPTTYVYSKSYKDDAAYIKAYQPEKTISGYSGIDNLPKKPDYSFGTEYYYSGTAYNNAYIQTLNYDYMTYTSYDKTKPANDLYDEAKGSTFSSSLNCGECIRSGLTYCT